MHKFSRSPGRSSVAVALLFALLLTAGRGFAQPVETKKSFQQDLRGLSAMPENMRTVGAGVRWESAGARVTAAAGHDRLPTAGVSASFQIKGDFEITASFEILKAETPADGYGVGVSIYAAIDTDTQHSVSLARRVMPNGNNVFVSDRMQPGADQPGHFVKVMPAKANTGKLRIQRIGTNVRFLVADGSDGEFVPILQTPTGGGEKTEFVQFGSSELRFVQIGADAGTSQAGFDVRFFDFAVRAEDLPGLTQATKPGAAPPSSGQFFQPAPSPPASNNQTLLYVFVGLGIVLAGGGGAGTWFFMRRQKSKPAETPKPQAAPKTKKVDEPIPIACEHCDKKLRVKPVFAGKRIKCTQCGKPIQVPAIPESHSVKEPRAK
jgi:hypothetical protein